ncbi:sugar transferase [Pseudoruegeria sp. SK021]|uniref:sugar transferase n=1 Tax=Pseudoruegeria sp. SK021 TaxID=1933035 RepID=UPI000A226618|nr:sugar transferase [Pseudoruegeria sp. SK021]OSP56813.1 sugar transferase [Pseudoruegeria sp. SK021]
MTWGKRCLDVSVAALMLVLLSPVILIVAVAIAVLDGRPIFYASERMKTRHQAFTLLKFRTMHASGARQGVTGGDKAGAITRTGRWLRAVRLDELPQLLNILRGDISLVGPRPPLRLYVEAAPELYDQVLQARPGLTGLATLMYHRHEADILAACTTPAQTHEAYLRRCVPAKARLDLIYLRHQSVCFDLWLLWRTICSVLRLG